MTLEQVVSTLSQYLEERNIPLDGLTMILNFQHKDGGARIDAALNREFSQRLLYPTPLGHLDVRDFKILGIRIMIESPVHEPPGLAQK